MTSSETSLALSCSSPQELLNAYDLVQVKMPDSEIGLFEDLMITRKERRYTDFVQELMHQILEVEREIMV